MLEVSITKQLDSFQLHVDLTFNGEMTAIVGPSGSGKTTILNCISGITNPDNGVIKLHNQSFFDSEKKLHIDARHRKIGYIFQEYALFPHFTVKKNINYIRPNVTETEETKHLIDLLNVSHLLERYPQHLSGGEKQRISLIRALANKPHALLLDEPFSSLDDETRSLCQNQLIQVYNKWKIPFIIVTHSHVEAEKLASRIITIEQGRIKKDQRLVIN